jgi:hypothetical protein
MKNPLSCVEEACEALSNHGKVQTLIFSKSHFSRTQAVAWARGHGFSARKVDVKPSTWRIRQSDPRGFERMRTVRFAPGVEAVIGWRR